MKKKKISLNNPWFVTLISTMIGIISGLYITSYFENDRLHNAKENALQQVENELKENQILLKDFNEKLNKKHKPVGVLLSKIDDEMNLIIHKDSLESFKSKTSKVFHYTSFTAVDATQIKLHGSFDFKIEAGLMGKKLSSIVWNSYKQTNYLSITSFKCLTDIETFYELQEEVNVQTATWKKEFYQAGLIGNKQAVKKFMYAWEMLLLQQKLLLDYYGFIDEVLAKCK
ncbi:MAG: hypothetical protein AB8B65_14700 [Kordia sp.]|uniref:hypothetical protein n=1 Tax=Kordia sp. TaxID=1965332 RepID=UPI00385E5A27